MVGLMIKNMKLVKPCSASSAFDCLTVLFLGLLLELSQFNAGVGDRVCVCAYGPSQSRLWSHVRKLSLPQVRLDTTKKERLNDLLF